MKVSAKNMKLLAHHEMNGFGNCGEGLAMQKTRDKRRVLWIAHESAPKNVTAIDVTNPKKPGLITQTELPHEKMRSNSLDLVGDLLVVAYQTREHGAKPAGFQIFDVADPSKPKPVVFFDCSGPSSRGVHHLWWVDGEYVHIASGAPDFTPRNLKDDQFYRIVDVKNISKPQEVGRWWLPGTRDSDSAPALPRNPTYDTGYRAHNTNVYPQRPDRAYVGYIDGGACVLDISDKAHPKLLGRWDYQPPFPGFCHTVLPFFSKNLLIVSDESTRPKAEDWPKLVWIVDARREDKLVPVATCPLPPVKDYAKRGNGRFGAHNLHENRPGGWISEDIVVGTFFNGGLRAYDVRDPLQPKEVAYFVPEAPKKSPAKSIQINDVHIDDRKIVYTVDRITGGLYILEMKV
jgi:hypothetical protein